MIFCRLIQGFLYILLYILKANKTKEIIGEEWQRGIDLEASGMLDDEREAFWSVLKWVDRGCSGVGGGARV
jgi:hypothetical protein